MSPQGHQQVREDGFCAPPRKLHTERCCGLHPAPAVTIWDSRQTRALSSISGEPRSPTNMGHLPFHFCRALRPREDERQRGRSWSFIPGSGGCRHPGLGQLRIVPIVPASLLIVPSATFKSVLVWRLDHVSPYVGAACMGSRDLGVLGSHTPCPHRTPASPSRVHATTTRGLTPLLAARATGSGVPGLHPHLRDPVHCTCAGEQMCVLGGEVCVPGNRCVCWGTGTCAGGTGVCGGYRCAVWRVQVSAGHCSICFPGLWTGGW